MNDKKKNDFMKKPTSTDRTARDSIHGVLMLRLESWWLTKQTSCYFQKWQQSECDAMNAKMRYYDRRERLDRNIRPTLRKRG